MPVWTTWLSRLAETAPLGGLLYIGADRPDLLAVPGPDRAERIVLAAATPALQQDYAEFAEQRGGVRLRPVVAGEGRAARLHVLSLPGLSATAAPRGVLDLFPGLRTAGAPEVPVAGLAALMADLPGPERGLRVLRAELSGAEPAILRQLAALPEDDAPDHVFLRLPAPGLYEAAEDTPEAPAAPEVAGFTLEERSDADPDFPEFWLRRDPRKAENRRLHEALAAAQAQAEADAARIAELEARLRTQTEARETAEAAARAAEAEAQTAKAEARAAKAEARTAREARQDQGEARADAARLEAEAAQNTTLRLQAMARSDVQELRGRHEALLAERDEQDALLGQVVARLRALLAEAPAGEAKRHRTKPDKARHDKAGRDKASRDKAGRDDAKPAGPAKPDRRKKPGRTPSDG